VSTGTPAPDPRGLSTTDLESLAALSAETPTRRIEHALEIARQILGMEFGFVTEFRGDEQILRGVSGDSASFDMSAGDGYPLDGTYCQRMVLGTIPKIVPNTADNDELRDLAMTKLSAIGSYVGVPIYLSDGKMYGTFCTISHEPRSDLGERHLLLMQVLSNVVAAGVEQQRLEKDNERLRTKMAEMQSDFDEFEEDRRVTRILTSGEFQTIPRGTPPPK
jgi:GAF domain-containing protein